MSQDLNDGISRRRFLTTAAAAGAAVLGSTAKSYARIRGANDRIQLGLIGCGARGDGHLNMVGMSKQEGNLQVRSVCDLWSYRRERARERVKERLGDDAKTFQYSEEMLADPELDGVLVATADHQHARILAEVVRAGKDCYCEKPMANTLDDAVLARDAVRSSGQIVQMGSQWLSVAHQQKARDVVRSGKLGKITMVEQSWNYNGPRWHVPKDADVARIREQDTDWERWLLGRAPRPFDPRVYFEFRMFRDFSGGIPDQWYSHAAGLAHFFLDTYIPDDTVSNGGIFAWHDVRENPDTFTCASTFQEKEVLYKYSTSFGNWWGETTIIRGTEGTLFTIGGESSPQWWYRPEVFSGWESNVLFGNIRAPRPDPVPVLPDGVTEVPAPYLSDDVKEHMDDWVRGMRGRVPCNGTIESGFAHSVAVIMATRSYREGKKMYWDRANEQILDHPPAARGVS